MRAYLFSIFLFSPLFGCVDSAPQSAVERLAPEPACEEAADRFCTQYEECFQGGAYDPECRPAIGGECHQSDDPGSLAWQDACFTSLETMTCEDIRGGWWKFSPCFAHRDD